MTVPNTYYTFTAGYYYPNSVANAMMRVCPGSLRIKKPYTWNTYLGWNYYYRYYAGDYTYVPESGIVEYENAWNYYTGNPFGPTYVSFECGAEGEERYEP